MAARDIIQAAAGAAGATEANYIEDVFSTYLYAGNTTTQTINNGIDLATNGGLVWIKLRSANYGRNNLCDTVRGRANSLYSDETSTGFQGIPSTYELTSFNTNGFSLGQSFNNTVNDSGYNFVSWTFRKQAKFFDIVTYTGTGANRTIAHALGATPGMIIVKRTDTTGNWQVYHSGLTSAANSIQLNLSNAQASATTVWNSTAPTSSVFSVGTDATVNASGGTYVAYLYAASNSGGFGPAGTNSVVACGSYTGNGSASGPTVTLGWEPQFVLVKMSSSTGDWNIFDNMRGIATGGNDPYLFANTTAAEATTNGDLIDLTATGFQIKGTNAEVNTSAGTYIYLAIRRPMKTPTDATKVFMPFAVSNDIGSQTTGFPVDMFINSKRTGDANSAVVIDRLRDGPHLVTSSTAAELNSGLAPKFQSNTSFLSNFFGSGGSAIWSFKRAPGFFDVVCYTGTGSARTVAHNLGVAPELMIVKDRNVANSWIVYHANSNAAGDATTPQEINLFLNTTSRPNIDSRPWNNTAPTASVFTVGTYFGTNYSTSDNYVAYLFATCAGVSKVGSYTGNGSSQTINCGFAAGARFVLIKSITSGLQDWYVWDTARGIVSANDPHLSLNTTAAEVTTDDTIDPDSSGFIVNQVSATNVNVSSATYIYLAIA